jgi:hypothetical protein
MVAKLSAQCVAMFTYLGQMRAQASRLVTHQIIEAKVKTQIHKHVFQGN